MTHEPKAEYIEKCAKALTNVFFGALMRPNYFEEMAKTAFICGVEQCGYVEPEAFAVANAAYVEMKEFYETMRDSSVSTINRIGAIGMDWKQRAETAEAECLEQARLLGMGGQREAALMARAEKAECAVNHLQECIYDLADILGLETGKDRMEDVIEAIWALKERNK